MSNFVERLAVRSKKSKRTSEIKPAITPDMLPESLGLSEHVLPSPTVNTQSSARNRTGTKAPVDDDDNNNNDIINDSIQEESRRSTSKVGNEDSIPQQHSILGSETPEASVPIQVDRILARQDFPPNKTGQLPQDRPVEEGEKKSNTSPYEERKLRPTQRAATSTESEAQSVTISIDKIEVHAIMPEKTVALPEGHVTPTMSLEEYLKRRREGAI